MPGSGNPSGFSSSRTPISAWWGRHPGGREVIDMTRALKPSLLLLDLALPHPACMEILRELFDLRIGVRTIVLTAAVERQEIVELLKLGASGVISRKPPRRSCSRRSAR